MPITKSAKKAAKQSQKRRLVNFQFKDLMKSAVKKVKKMILAGDVSSVNEALVFAQKRIDKAAKKNIISENSASRKKSNLMKAVQNIDENAVPVVKVVKPKSKAKK